MPKISEQQWQERRQQILEAAWRCFFRNGVQATTIDDIIGESGMSASAMYRYFNGKDDIIRTAIASSLTGLGAALGPLLTGAEPQPPAGWMGEMLKGIERFCARRDFNLMPLGIHGWSEAQRDEEVRNVLRGYYLQFRAQIVARVEAWQRAGLASAEVPAIDVAETLMSTLLGYIVQATIMRDLGPESHARGLAGLMTASGADPR
ncbi:MAG: TetR/AcrR family transcriptional regulator [Proteobacteria bacterium]|nr:TetR/AcrR family transcriptional regulator [Pseudomonadota bacterium]